MQHHKALLLNKNVPEMGQIKQGKKNVHKSYRYMPYKSGMFAHKH